MQFLGRMLKISWTEKKTNDERLKAAGDTQPLIKP